VNARDELIEIVTSSPESSGGDVVWATDIVDAHRAEVLAEADLLPKAEVVAWLTKKAREETPVWLLASKVDRGAVRPDNLRMLPADFFEPGHSYSHCVAVTAHPTTSQRLAMGWLSERGEWHRPTVCNLGQWLHEYDGVQPPDSTPQHYDKVPDPADGCHWCACGNRWPCKDAGEATS
jgi:hypothetical protein